MIQNIIGNIILNQSHYLNNRRLFCPRGKMIGGCSAHNGMVFVRGNKNDYERWENFGLKSWSYDKILPYFKKIETGQEEKINIEVLWDYFRLINQRMTILYLKLF